MEQHPLVELRAAIAKALGDNFAFSYIDGGTLNPTSKVFTPRTVFAFERIKGNFTARGVLKEHGLTLARPELRAGAKPG